MASGESVLLDASLSPLGRGRLLGDICRTSGWMAGRSAIAGHDGRSILGHLRIELAHNLRNEILHRLAHLDLDRMLIGVGLLQDCELAVEKAGRYKSPFACGEAL